jgi:hypothetical protein
MSNGVIYYNKGTKCIVRLILAIQSLRRHYDGNITLFQDNGGFVDEDLMRDLQKKFSIDVKYDNNPETSTLVRKIEISQQSEYDCTALIDADTIVVGVIDELFEEAKSYDFVATHFSNWRSNGGTIKRRIMRFKDIKPEYIDDAINYGPAINTGIYSFHKGSPFFNEWLPLAKAGEAINMWIPDEVACQVLLPKFNCLVLPTKFNVSVKYDPNTEDKRIIHFHGKKHVIKEKMCKIWIDALYQACVDDLCGIRKFLDRSYGDRRLNKFFACKYGWEKEVGQIAIVLNNKMQNQSPCDAGNVINVPENIARGENKTKKENTPTLATHNQVTHDQVTIVTAADPKYIQHLQLTYPNWVKYKKITMHPLILYINGFTDGIYDKSLDFIRSHPNVKIIKWDLPVAENQREKMLSAFVMGPAKDVVTPYWIKIDADAFFTNDKALFDDEITNHVFCGHKWGYTKPGRWIKDLDDWAANKEEFAKTNSLFNPELEKGKRYCHSRTNSFVQWHNTEFVKEAVRLAPNRLPVPSHDTYLWYVAERLGLPWRRHNFKRYRGVTNASSLDKLKRLMCELGNAKEVT